MNFEIKFEVEYQKFPSKSVSLINMWIADFLNLIFFITTHNLRFEDVTGSQEKNILAFKFFYSNLIFSKNRFVDFLRTVYQIAV